MSRTAARPNSRAPPFSPTPERERSAVCQIRRYTGWMWPSSGNPVTGRPRRRAIAHFARQAAQSLLVRLRFLTTAASVGFDVLPQLEANARGPRKTLRSGWPATSCQPCWTTLPPMATQVHHAGKRAMKSRKRPSDLLEVWLELFKKIEGPRRGRETEFRRRRTNPARRVPNRSAQLRTPSFR
jgi:hypothetical protein